MHNQQNEQQENTAGKLQPQHVAGNNIPDTKEKTMPLQKSDNKPRDQEEGEMNNGEVGGGMEPNT